MENKRAVAIHDLSCFGRCALTVVMPTLSAMGIQTVPLPTALLSTHTGGFQNMYFLDLTNSMDAILSHWKELDIRFDAVYSGFIGNPRQSEIIRRVIREFGTDECIDLVDPVFGDDGELYLTCTDEIVEKMKELCCEADVITPNITEACRLCDLPYTNTALLPRREAREFAEYIIRELGKRYAKRIAVTGIEVTGDDGREILSAGLELTHGDGEVKFAAQPKVKTGYPGTGELFASVLLGRLLKGDEFHSAVSYSSKFVHDVVEYSSKYDFARRDGVLLEASLKKLADDNNPEITI